MQTVMDSKNDEVPVTPTKENTISTSSPSKPSKIITDSKNDQALLTSKNKNTMQTFSPSPHTRKRQLFYSPSPSESPKKTYSDKFGKYFLFFSVPYINDFLSSH